MTTNNLTIGIDLGDRKHSACVLSAGGEILAETEITNTRECLTVFAQRYPRAAFVMETGMHSPWVSRLLEVCQGGEVYPRLRQRHQPARMLPMTEWKTLKMAQGTAVSGQC